MNTKRRLELTYLDEGGRKRKTILHTYMQNIDSHILAEHLATMPGNLFSKNSRLNIAKLPHCIHASYVITQTHLLFKSRM